MFGVEKFWGKGKEDIKSEEVVSIGDEVVDEVSEVDVAEVETHNNDVNENGDEVDVTEKDKKNIGEFNEELDEELDKAA